MSDISIPKANDFSDVEVDSVKCINKMCDVIMSMHLDNVYITSKADTFSPYAVGFGPGKIFRFDRGAIMFSTASLPSADFMDLQMGSQDDADTIMSTFRGEDVALEQEIFVYESPGVALSWFLCKLGRGTNEANLEEDIMTFRPTSPASMENDIVMRLCFEKKRTPEQKMMYKAFASSVEQVSSARVESLDAKLNAPENPFEDPSSSTSMSESLGLDDLIGPKRRKKDESGSSEFSSNPFGDPPRDRSSYFGKSLLDKIKAEH